ncbi:hypothetical protein EW146_g5543 [Bondarzewia mesenterica]|uniref:C2H2-type domain-containing protein n=1 Tax=Bondarzewia mesenterica TaxID=1095465 RepID=A0A4S4LTA6_9AGAM|nr:hypothetical protein EW146_g5543 [Bondarzewia mesenterica]
MSHPVKQREGYLPKFPCEVCGAMTTKASMYRHKQLHKPDAHMFSCTYPGCNFRTLQNSNLAQHIRGHTREKYSCPAPGCNYSAVHLSTVCHHKRKFHPDMQLRSRASNAVLPALSDPRMATSSPEPVETGVATRAIDDRAMWREQTAASFCSSEASGAQSPVDNSTETVLSSRKPSPELSEFDNDDLDGAYDGDLDDVYDGDLNGIDDDNLNSVHDDDLDDALTVDRVVRTPTPKPREPEDTTQIIDTSPEGPIRLEEPPGRMLASRRGKTLPKLPTMEENPELYEKAIARLIGYVPAAREWPRTNRTRPSSPPTPP